MNMLDKTKSKLL